jgi:hypothetical protein
MLNYKVISLYNKTNHFIIDVYQRTKTEYKVKTQIGFNSFNDDYVWGLYDLSKVCFFYIVNNYEMTQNNLGFEFAYAVHAGDFSEYEPPFNEPSFKEEEVEPTSAPLRRTGYENSLQIEEPSILIRTENVILDPEVELPWKLAD